MGSFIKNSPLWALIGVLGGLFAFLGLFMNVYSVGGFVGDLGTDFEMGWTGIKIITFNNDILEFTFYKFFPLVVAILGLCLVLYSVHSMASSNPSKMPLIIVGITSAVMLVLIIIFICMCFNNGILGEGLELEPGAKAHACAGAWFMLLGSVLGVVSAALSKFKPEL